MSAGPLALLSTYRTVSKLSTNWAELQVATVTKQSSCGWKKYTTSCIHNELSGMMGPDVALQDGKAEQAELAAGLLVAT